MKNIVKYIQTDFIADSLFLLHFYHLSSDAKDTWRQLPIPMHVHKYFA